MIYVKTNNKSTQNWLIVESIDKNGIIKIKNKNIFIKLIRVQPINFNLKTTLEKEAILNSYKILLKTSTKNYYIIIDEQSEIENENLANIYYMLNEKYFKIKECLNKCGNQVKECKKEDVIKVLHFFLNTNYNLNR